MKTKISKTTWIVLGTGIFLVLIAVLGMTYRNQTAEQSRLNQQIASVNQQINKIPLYELTEKESGLKIQLAQTDAKVSAVKVSLAQSTNAIDAVSTLFNLAYASSVDLYEIKSTGITAAPQNQEKVPFNGLPLTLGIRGDVTNILAFVQKITDTFSTSIVKPVDIKVPVPAITPASASTSTASQITDTRPTGTITLNILSYKEK